MSDRGADRRPARLDKWLWSVRLYKTRNLAAEACRRGQVCIDGTRSRASRQVSPGMTIELRLPAITRSVRVLATPETRVGAKLTEKFYADITTQEERERAARIRQENRMNRVFDVPGQGRPDKQQQRKIRKFLEKQDNPDC